MTFLRKISPLKIIAVRYFTPTEAFSPLPDKIYPHIYLQRPKVLTADKIGYIFVLIKMKK
jgi:hypothetical protein